VTKATEEVWHADRSGSQEDWGNAQADVETDLRAQGQTKLQPDQIVQSTVQALNAWATGDDKLREATENA